MRRLGEPQSARGMQRMERKRAAGESGLKYAPESLRQLLERALHSNGKVHAPNSLRATTLLPTFVFTFREELFTHNATTLHAAEQSDEHRHTLFPTA